MNNLNSKILFIFLIISINCDCYSQNYYEEACKQYFNGNDDKISVELFTKAIENNQDVAKSYMYRGASKTFLNDFFGALSDIEESIRQDSSNYKAYYYRGRLYFAQGFFNKAVNQYNIAISKNPTDADVYDVRAIARAKESNYEGAIEDENTAIKINPMKADYYNNRGFAKSELKQYKEAIKDFDMALKTGNAPRAYANKGIALSALGMYKEAIENFTIGIEKMPKAKDMNYYRALSYQALGKKELACQDLAKSAEMGYQPAISEQKKTCLKSSN
jgi:tetratricopeptide (TPR) repeat protein